MPVLVVDRVVSEVPSAAIAFLGYQSPPAFEKSDRQLPAQLLPLLFQPARKICVRLGIQQKVIGKEAPLSWLALASLSKKKAPSVTAGGFYLRAR
jgi:hypothetical protein